MRVFTGLVEEKGTILAIGEGEGGGSRLRIGCGFADELSSGDSVAVNGVCLTALAPGGGAFEAEAMGETLSRSSIGE